MLKILGKLGIQISSTWRRESSKKSTANVKDWMPSPKIKNKARMFAFITYWSL